MAKKWYIGCSGYYYKDWKEIFYPKGLPQTKWFDFYCEHFNTLELNVTFYRFPSLNVLQNWYRKAPDDFIFSVKVPKAITHESRFEGSQSLAMEFYDMLSLGLAEKLGPVLYQLPPSITFAPEMLEAIISHIDENFKNVIEFRHISWWRKEVIQTLTDRGISFCGVSFPGLIADVMTNTPTAYYRFHGVPKLYYSEYDDAFLEKVVQTLHGDKKVKEAFLYFNNTAAAAALQNARYVQELVDAQGW